MRSKFYANQSPLIARYVEDLLQIEQDPQLCLVLKKAKQRGTPPLQVIPTDGRHLEVLAHSVQAKKIVEIGTLCGYSAVCLARGLQEGGKLYTCERSAHHAAVAKEVFELLGLNHKIQILFGDALENLSLLSKKAPFDLVFIDANKQQYSDYYEWAVKNLRKGGLLVADNVFVFNSICDDQIPKGPLLELAQSMRDFNQKCVNDKRLLTTILPTGEGMLVSVKINV